jgi:phosphohistidine swiveling domain-containing protein
MLPLSWLPQVVGDDALILYKDSVVHIYHLNGKEKKAAETGFRYFTKPGNVVRWLRQVDDILRGIQRIVLQYRKAKFDDLNETELKYAFLNFSKTMVDYCAVYARTEDIHMVKFEEDARRYAKLMEKLGRTRLRLRKEGEIVFYTLFNALLDEIGRRFKLHENDIFFCTEAEVLALFAGKKVAASVLSARRAGYAVIHSGEKKFLLTGIEFKKVFAIVKKSEETKEIVGKVAMPGYAQGVVRAILHNKGDTRKDVAAFKKGEILVTEMTRPDTIVACRRAAAIVTDEGGVTCHAAIIAREFGIPCVIGTKIATQDLKTGMTVEVNAAAGTVKIIKQ